jgi:hypothetical protein
MFKGGRRLLHPCPTPFRFWYPEIFTLKQIHSFVSGLDFTLMSIFVYRSSRPIYSALGGVKRKDLRENVAPKVNNISEYSLFKY